MASPSIITHTGAVNGSPAQSSISSPSLTELLNTSFTGTYGSSKGARPTINGATDLVPFVIALETIVKVRVLIMRVRGGSLVVKLTSAAGIKQAIPVSELLMISTPSAGAEITSIECVGTADLEYIAAGDVG